VYQVDEPQCGKSSPGNRRSHPIAAGWPTIGPECATRAEQGTVLSASFGRDPVWEHPRDDQFVQEVSSSLIRFPSLHFDIAHRQERPGLSWRDIPGDAKALVGIDGAVLVALALIGTEVGAVAGARESRASKPVNSRSASAAGFCKGHDDVAVRIRVVYLLSAWRMPLHGGLASAAAKEDRRQR
jgi:hypothetical protein